jgi:hypothetical protein
MTIINIADIVCPSDSQGRTYRQINAENVHEIPLGSLVENPYDGTRAFVVQHGRDCDQTPLYTLSLRKEDVGRTAVECGAHAEGFRAPHWESGYPAEMLTVISRGD